MPGHDSIHRQTALDRAAPGRSGPPRLSFPRFAPTVSLGRHQSRRHEVRESWCAEAGIAVTHRETAGGALYLDAGQQCLTLTLPRSRLGPDLASRLARAAAILGDGLARLGVATSFKAPNDLQVDGRQKIASVFLAEEGDTATLFGTVIVTLDLAAASAFWERLGFVAFEPVLEPLPKVVAASRDLNVGLYAIDLQAPVLVFTDAAMPERIANLRDRGHRFAQRMPRELLAIGGAMLVAPEGTQLLLLKELAAA